MADDLSEHARQLRDARAALEAVSKEYEAFAHSVSHDLRAPLRGIDMYTGIVADEYRDRLDEEGKRLLELTRSLTRKMNGLIDDLLAFSRLGRQRMVLSMVDMAALAQSIFDELKGKMPSRRVRLELGPLPRAFADAALIKQVFGHLLSNAFKFSAPREEAVISVTGTNGNQENTYCVRDNGVGFDPEFAGKLFGMFQRMHSQEEFEGAGAGLALTQRIVQRHGGRIWAESREGQGAMFCFTLAASPPGGEGSLK